MSTIVSSSQDLQEPQIFNDFSSLLGDSYDPVTGMYGDCRRLFDAIWNNDSPSPYQEDVFKNFIPSPNAMEDSYSATSTYEGEWPRYSDWGYWVNEEEDSWFSSCCRWDDDFFSYADENMHSHSRLERAEDSFQGEEERGTYVSHYRSGESQISWDVVPWSCQDSWFGYQEEGNKYRYTYSLEDLGFCGEIFGYWPCLARALQQ